MSDSEFLEYNGYCPICEAATTFRAHGRWYRGTLMCRTCENGSVPRERALALMLNRLRPHWRQLLIHESSPVNRGLSVKIRRECDGYIATHFFPEEPMGSIVNGFRNENFENTTFDDSAFDIVMSLDVLEHVFNPDLLFKDVHRTLRPGGLFISTFPIRKYQVEPHVQRARTTPTGSVEHLVTPPEYHGNPISGSGALVTYDYGYDIHQVIPKWAPFEVEITRFHNRNFGIIGEYTEVITCYKI